MRKLAQTKRNRRKDPWVVVARFVRPRGNRGELLAEILTDWPEERLVPGDVHLRDRLGRVHPGRVEETWFHKDRVVVKLEGVEGIGEAEEFRGWEWILPVEERHDLPEDTWYTWELEGMEAVDAEGGALGEVRSVETGTGADLLVLLHEGREILVPVVRRYVLSVDREAGRVRLDLPDDLLHLNDR